VASQRKQPGFTVLENVSSAGFRSCVREWAPGGRAMPRVKLWIASGRLYPPRSPQVVTYIRLRDGRVRRATPAADAEGRLQFALDGEEYEVGVGSAPALTLAGAAVEGAAWATAGRPVRLRVRFYNKGGAASGSVTFRWESPNPGVQLDTASATLPGLAPGQPVERPLVFAVKDEAREIVKLFAVNRETRLPLEVALFPPAAGAPNFQIADGRAFSVFQHAVERADLILGQGNGDGRANPGETFAILLPDGDGYRAAELFTNDSCVDNSTRVSDSWSSYDHVGASAKYSLASIKPWCPPGRVVRMLSRVMLPNKPNHRVRYGAIELTVGAAGKKPTKRP